jgi:hypothetical protein
MVVSCNRSPFFTRMLVALIALAAHSAVRAEEVLLVGMLEEMPPTFLGDHLRHAVRVAFQRTHDGWQSFPSDC